MKNIILLLVGILLLSNISLSEKVPISVAEAVARNFIGMELQFEFDNMLLVKTVSRNNTPLCYYFNFPSNNGYIMVAADDHVHPILGYSDNHAYRENDNFPPQYISWMNNYYDQIEYVIQNKIPSDYTIDNEWQDLLNKTNPSNRGTTSVLPLLTTTWNQGCYYNGSCPVDAAGPCGRVLTGCVATAMAQIMKYHNWPPQGTGSHSYIHPVYGTLSADFGATTYNWAGMPNNVTSSNSSVATLIYHCGVSVEMNYGPYSSGASTSDVVYALETYFSYNPVCEYYYKSNYTETVWENMLKEDLDNSQPIQYRGSGPDGGHSFVCDGYSGTNYFHFNWGWSGAYDGYFYLSNLNPGGYTFNVGQAAIMDIQPLSSDPCSSITSIGGCGSGYAQTYTGGGSGAWFTSTANPCGYTTSGVEKIYSFVAPTTGTYSIQVTAASGYVDYLWKTSSCSSSGWTCIADIASTGQYGAMSWTSGTTYYILLDDENSTTGTHTFYINCPVICVSCPTYDFSITPSSAWLTHSSSHVANGCKMYRMSVTSGQSYIFKTGCGNGATASYDTYLELYNTSCSLIASDDDGCESNRSIIEWTANFTGYAYLKVRGYGSGSGSYTLAYIKNTVPLTRILQNITISSGQNLCYDATQTISLAGSTTTFVLQSGGELNLIAGQNILMLPGTFIHSGGNMMANITTSGEYCASLPLAMVSNDPLETENDSDIGLNSTGFSVTPNPANGPVTLQFNPGDGPQDCIVQVYNMTGARIASQEVLSSRSCQFSLIDQAPGIYIIQVVREDRVDEVKIIKN